MIREALDSKRGLTNIKRC